MKRKSHSCHPENKCNAANKVWPIFVSIQMTAPRCKRPSEAEQEALLSFLTGMVGFLGVVITHAFVFGIFLFGISS